MRIESIKANDVQYNSQRLTSGELLQKEFPIEKRGGNKDITSQKKYNEEEIKVAVGTVNKAINPYDRRLEFSIHETTNIVSVKVIDTNTDEVIREIPPEKILDMVGKLWEMAGIIIDKKI